MNFEFLQNITYNNNFKLLVIFVILDLVFGVLRAIKQKQINSTIGIDGMIRKTAMLVSVIFLSAVDSIVKIDVIGFIPEIIKEAMHFETVSLTDLFSIFYTLFEILSILKNAIFCELPIPKGIREKLENLLKDWTSEVKEK